MIYSDQIKAQEAEIARLGEEYEKARGGVLQAKLSATTARDNLNQAKDRLLDLERLGRGLSPYLCGELISREGAYRVQEKTVWWTPVEAKQKREQPMPYVYIVALGDDSKTWKTLVHLSGWAPVPHHKMYELQRLPRMKPPEAA